MAGQIDQHKQEIAGLISEFIGMVAVEGCFDLVGLFANLAQHLAGIVPVESHS